MNDDAKKITVSDAAPALLSLHQVGKVFQETGSAIEVFNNLSFQLRSGDFTAITGASGVGKSTLLHILGLLDSPSIGRVFFLDQDTGGLSDRKLSSIRNREIGFVFQFHHLLPDFTALENVLMPKRILGFLGKDGERRAKDLLALVGLENRMTHLPSELSGGERQRIALARALINEPRVLLCDEPSGNLDMRNSENLHQMLLALNRDLGVSLLVVTHDPNLAALAHKSLVMDADGLHNPSAGKGVGWKA